jgi:hypothetical protein
LLVKLLLRLPWWASAVVGFTVFSHWVLDYLVHRPDLPLWPGGESVGLGLWNYPAPEQALEIGLLAVCGAVWVASRKTLGRFAWPAIALIGFLVAVQIAVMFFPQVDGEVTAETGAMILALYLIVAGVAALTDIRGKRTT